MKSSKLVGALLAAVAAAVVAVPIATAADDGGGSGSSGNGITDAAVPQPPSRADMEKLRSCLSDQGVDLPDPPAEGEAPSAPPEPPSDETMPSPEEMQDAFEACKEFAPDPPEGAPEGAAPGGVMPFGGPGAPGGPGGMPCPDPDQKGNGDKNDDYSDSGSGSNKG